MQKLRPFLTVLALYLVVAVLFAPDAAVGTGVFWHHDFRHHHYPWRVWAAQQWAQGVVPWWSSGAANGFPLLAEGQGGFLYAPTMLLFLLLDGGRALDWAVIGHQVWAALGVWALCRAMGLRGAPAFLGGLAWAWGGFLISHTLYLGMQNGAAWLGWALWGTQARRPAMSALAIGMMGLAGHPQAAAFGGLLFGIHALWMRNVRSLVAGAVGVLIASPQLVASLELSQFSMRDGGVAGAFAQVGRLPIQELVNGVLPYAFGYDRPADIAETYYHRGLGYWGAGENHWEMAFYLGIPVVVCALTGVRKARFWGVIAALSVLLMIGGPLWEALRHLPGFGYFRFPARFGMWLSLATSILAAHGLERLRRARRPWQMRRPLFVVAGIFGVVTFAAFVVLRVEKEPIEALGRAHFAKQVELPPPPEMGALLRAALPAPEPEDAAAIPAKVERIWQDLVRSTAPDSPRVAIPVLLLVLSALALRHPRRMVVLALVDLWWFGHDYHPRVPTQELAQGPHWLTDAMTQPGGPRTTVLDRRVDPALDNKLLTASLGLPLGTNDVVIPSPLLLVRNEAMLGKVGLDVGDKGDVKVTRFLANHDLARRMGVRWIASIHDIPGLLPVDHAPEFTVWEDRSALPRARMVPCQKAAADGDAAYALVAVTDPEQAVIVEGGEAGCGAGGTAEITSYTEQAVTIRTSGAGTLVLADSWYPRWTASVDGVTTPILQGDVLFRAVPVSVGEHVVEFRFDPGLAGKLLLPALFASLLCLGATLHASLRPTKTGV